MTTLALATVAVGLVFLAASVMSWGRWPRR
jgi:hypothetical protein